MDYFKQVQSELLVVTKNGRPVAAINIIADAEELKRLMLASNSWFNLLTHQPEIQSSFKDYWKQFQSELLVITEDGRPVAAINLIADAEELKQVRLAANSRFNQVLEAADQQIQKTGGIRHDDFWKLLEEA